MNKKFAETKKVGSVRAALRGSAMPARLWLALFAILLLGRPTAVAGGVVGLLALSKSRLRCGHVAGFFSGRVVGVDLSVWLYHCTRSRTSSRATGRRSTWR